MDNLARKVHTIPRSQDSAQRLTRLKALRVAAYCRVSTDEEEQLSSYKAQMLYYTQKIENNPDYKLAGIFADEGLSGTATKNRDEFNKLMTLCKRGKIDLILTKSISRFARNTLDAIGWVRKLKLIGVGVYFEKENINTLNMPNEMVLTMLSAFAQAESESISENVRWGKRHAMKEGHVPFQYSRILDYERGDDDKPRIVPEQARTVQRIFASYLAGYSIAQIKAELEAEGIPSASGKPQWSHSVLNYMLRNEKYIGDALLQKSYVVDCISKQVRVNRGELPQYYVENNHEPIISRDIFRHVQEELARRSSKRRVSEKTVTERGKYSAKYALSELLVCGDCGTAYRRVTWARGGVKRIVWRCINRLENDPKHCNASPTVDEYLLHDALFRAINTALDLREEIITELDDTLQTTIAKRKSSDAFDRHKAQQDIAVCEQKASAILALVRSSADLESGLDAPLTKIYDERAELLAALAEDDARRERIAVDSTRLESLKTVIRNMPPQVDEYRDEYVRGIMEKIRVNDADSLTVTLKGGFEFDVGVKDGKMATRLKPCRLLSMTDM